MTRCSSRRNTGFSLVELMVVVSITTLIATLSIPAFTGFKIRAARAEVYHNMNGIHTAAEAYAAENDGGYPLNGWLGIGGSPGGMGGTTYNSGDYINTCAEDYSWDVNFRRSITTTMGYQVDNCSRLRYLYYFDGRQYLGASAIGFGSSMVNISGGPSGQTTYTLLASSSVAMINGIEFWTEGVPAVRPTACMLTATTGIYDDVWVSTDNMRATHLSKTYDPMKVCR